MAVTSIWPINGSLAKVIDYARNPKKTQEKSLEKLAALHAIDGVIEYAANDMKTEERKYVFVQHCSSEDNAAKEFMMTKKLFNKKGGRACFHGYQSFKPGEVTAEQAHKIGKELAKRLWPDFDVLIATHCNTDCYHNHFVINSVSYKDGHHFHNSPADYRRMREESDRLCREYGLSVIENPAGKGKSYGEYAAEKSGKPTIRGAIRADIDRAAQASLTREQFFDLLEDAGYELKLYAKSGDWLEHPSLKPPGAKGFFRFHKLGKGYDLDSIERRIWRNLNPREPFPEEEERQVREYRTESPPPIFERRKPYLYRLYLRYCYELHIIEKHPASVQRVSFFMREDLIKLDKLDAETRLLAKNKISTPEELFSYKRSVESKIGELTEKRRELRNDIKRYTRQGDDSAVSEAKAQISEKSKELKKLRKEVELCDDIVLRSAKTREELEWLLDQQEIYDREEETNDELLRGRGGTGREVDAGGR